jgi:hypothetical protein
MLMADVRPAEAIDAGGSPQTQPQNEATLGRLAAAFAAVDGCPEKTRQEDAAVIDDAEMHNPRCSEFYLAMGESFDQMRAIRSLPLSCGSPRRKCRSSFKSAGNSA